MIFLNILPWIFYTILYIPVFSVLYKGKWDETDYSHAYFILPLALLILYTKRNDFSHKIKPSLLAQIIGFILILSSLYLFMIGWRHDYMVLQVGTCISLAFGLILFLYDTRFLRIALYPLLYLTLLVPIPQGILDTITLPMRKFASIISVYILQIFQYPVSREGLLITLGNHEIFMGVPCSGFRSLITMFSIGLIYIYFNKTTIPKNIILVLSIIPFTLFGNIVRVTTLCVITYYFGEEAGEGFFHDFSGIVVFFILACSLILFEKFLNRKGNISNAK